MGIMISAPLPVEVRMGGRRYDEVVAEVIAAGLILR